MELLCEVCDRSIIEKKCQFDEYLTTMGKKKNDKSFYENYIINNVNLDEVDKTPNDYITSHNKKFNIYFIKF